MAIPTAQGNESDNPLLQRWNTPYGLPPFGAVRPEHFEPAFDAAIAAHRAEIDAIGADPEPPTFDEHDRRVRPRRPDARALEPSVLQPDVERDLAGAAGGRDDDGAAPRRARQRGLDARARCSRASSSCTSGVPSSASVPRQLRVLERYHPDFIRAGARLGAAEQQRYADDHGAAGRADDAVRPERARRRGRLPPRAARRERARRPARLRARGGAPGRRRTRHRRLRDHAVALARRAVPDLLGPARPARAGLPRLDDARRARGPDRQPAACARDPRAAPRAGAPARLRVVRRLRAGRVDGAPTGQRDRAARAGLGAGLRPRRDRARGARGARAVARRAEPDRGLGLALLRREGAQGPLRLRRGAGQAVFPARPAWPRRRSTARRGCSASGSSSSRRSRPTTRTSRSTRCAAPTVRWSACSCTTTSRGRRSAAARGWAPTACSRATAARAAKPSCRSSSTTTTSRRRRSASRPC